MKQFWNWYERHKTLNLGIAAGLFTIQLVHLFWLTTHVVWARLFGEPLFNPQGLFETLIVIVDYTEIPAILTTSLVYINEYRTKRNFKSLLYLFFLNSQWLHIFWITDEFVVSQFGGMSGQSLPLWLAWIAIMIDYLELPVIFDTLRAFFKALRSEGFTSALEELKEE